MHKNIKKSQMEIYTVKQERNMKMTSHTSHSIVRRLSSFEDRCRDPTRALGARNIHNQLIKDRASVSLEAA